MRVSMASAVVVHRIPADTNDWFLDWQRGVSDEAAAFPGYTGTDVYPPGEVNPGEWVVVLHFESQQALNGWLGSAVRAEWVARYRERIGPFDLTPMPSGFGTWFASRTRGVPPTWKMALTVLLGLYPTVVLLSVGLGPVTKPLGFALGVLVGNAVSVVLLQWAIMPMVTRVARPWLRADGAGWRTHAAGVAIVAGLIAGMAVAFRWAFG